MEHFKYLLKPVSNFEADAKFRRSCNKTHTVKSQLQSIKYYYFVLTSENLPYICNQSMEDRYQVPKCVAQ